LIADNHFGHERIPGFRPEFASVEEMGEAMAEN
jgi:calcineurin-like phosphoesterase family protein